MLNFILIRYNNYYIKKINSKRFYMEKLVNDPYLNTVKINLADKRIKHKRDKNTKRDSFLSQKVYITDYMNISEEVASIIFLIAFLLIPYGVGFLFVFCIFAQNDIDIFKRINIDEYYILWSIGYEIIALFLLLLIFKSAINFKLKRL